MQFTFCLAVVCGVILSTQVVAQGLALGPGNQFSFAALTAEAKRLASEPPRQRKATPEWLSEIDPAIFRGIEFKPEKTLWLDDNTPFRVQLFHPGRFYTQPVQIFEIAEGVVTPVEFDPAMFNYAEPLPGSAEEIEGFAGFRIQYPLDQGDRFDEVLAFSGASYFRAVGRGNRYGASARGLAIDTGAVDGEEFPDFSAFWIERPNTATSMVIYALLESESVVGAYRFEVVPGERTEIATQVRLFFRSEVERLGIAPLTSMYFFGPNDRVGADDYRPRVHNSHGLNVWRDDGTIIWRPLANPTQLHWTVLQVTNPRSFGLFQRDREFETYEDLEARYDLRPSVWVEPIQPFGEGSVVLLELPVESENNDNIVTFWLPRVDTGNGVELTYSYRVFWSAQGLANEAVSKVIDTRLGAGDPSGGPAPDGTRTVVIDFSGISRPFDQLMPVVNGHNAELSDMQLRLNPITNSYRLSFDVTPTDTPSELSAWLEADGQRVSELWIYRLDET